MNPLESLYSLQEIELHIAQVQKRLNEISAALSDNRAVSDAQQQLEAARQNLVPLQTKTRNLELEIQSNNDKIRQTDEALYSGRVRNPKELQDMQHEIQLLKKRTADLEDTLLETMLLVETAEAEHTQKLTALTQVQADGQKNHQGLLEDQSKLKVDLAALGQKRAELLPQISEDNLKAYNTLKPRKSNQPIALLVNESCSFCRVEQEMAIISEARRGRKLMHCSSCGRILVYRSG